MLKTIALLAVLTLAQGGWVAYTYPADGKACDSTPVSADIQPLNVCVGAAGLSLRTTASADKKTLTSVTYKSSDCTGEVFTTTNTSVSCNFVLTTAIRYTIEDTISKPAPTENDSASLRYLGDSCGGNPLRTIVTYGQKTTATCSSQSIGNVKASSQTVSGKDVKYPKDGAGAIATASFALIATLAFLL